MRLYRTTCALSSDDGLCVEMGVSGGGRVAVAGRPPRTAVSPCPVEGPGRVAAGAGGAAGND